MARARLDCCHVRMNRIAMRLAEPEGTNKSVREKASDYKVREEGVDPEGKYSCCAMKNPYLVRT